MKEKYFKKFKYIKQSNNAKSVSFYMTKNNPHFSRELYKQMKKILKKRDDKFRISLHSSTQSKLHNMVIGLKKGDIFPPHKHKKDEAYQIVYGKLALVTFNKKGKIKKKIILSLNESLIAKIEKNTYHGIVALTDVIYHEIRLGPFISKTDSTFPSWSVEFKGNKIV